MGQPHDQGRHELSAPVGVDPVRGRWPRLVGWLALFALLRLGRVVCLLAQRSPLAVRLVRATGRLLGLPRGR